MRPNYESMFASMSVKDLVALEKKVTAALVTAKDREKSALRDEMRAIAEARGLSLGEILAVAPTKGKRRRSTLTPMRDKKTGVEWAGAGRYPPNFVKSRAEALR